MKESLIRGSEYLINIDVLAVYDRIYKAPFKVIYIGDDFMKRPEFCTLETNGIHSGHDLFSIDNDKLENIIKL